MLVDDGEAARGHELRAAIGGDERDAFAVGRELRLRVHAGAIDDRSAMGDRQSCLSGQARLPVLHTNCIDACFVLRAEAAARRCGVGDLGTVRRPRHALDEVGRRRERAWRASIHTADHKARWIVGRVSVNDERFRSGIAREIGDRFAIRRPLERAHALRSIGERVRRTARDRNREHLRPFATKSEE